MCTHRSTVTTWPVKNLAVLVSGHIFEVRWYGEGVCFVSSAQSAIAFIYSDLLLTSRFKDSPAKNEKMTYTYMHVHTELFKPRCGVTHTDMQKPACNFYTSVTLRMSGDILFIEIFFFVNIKTVCRNLIFCSH